MRWRKLIIATHRDIGYFFAGLTVIYAISGIAVNHIDSWNPNYILEPAVSEIGQLKALEHEELAQEILNRLSITDHPKSVVRMSPEQLKIFFNKRTLTIALPGGRVFDERVERRFAFFEMNYLHLNHGKGFWTFFADLYALGLLILACTGIFIITGKKGLGGRGRRLLIAGLVIPIIYLIMKL